MINVTKSYLPPKEEYIKHINEIWERGWLTNHGPLVNELESRLKDLLGVKHLFFVSNGTIALQIAIKALEVKGEVVTTPFSYVATASSLAWEGCAPIFADINPKSLTINPREIEKAVTAKTSAILATHVYGIPCDVQAIAALAKKKKLRVIYDAAHAFGVKINGKSVLKYGDISTLSFHATKLFHTVEGGAIVTEDDELAHKISYLRNFGHKGQEDFWGLGINGKNSEFHAAMGLCVLPHIDEIIAARKQISEQYDSLLLKTGIEIEKPVVPKKCFYNYAYYPILLKDEKTLLSVKDMLNANYVYPRRYFYPALTHLNYVKTSTKSVAENVSKRVLCLPLYHGLEEEDVTRISNIILKAIQYKP